MKALMMDTKLSSLVYVELYWKNVGIISLPRVKLSPIIEQYAGTISGGQCFIITNLEFRALVAEALEISSFMEKMGDANNNEELRDLAMGDWAKYTTGF